MSVQGRMALVSGAAQGIGRAIAVRLAAAGAFVALLDRDGEGVEAAAAELKGATAWVCDVRDSQEVRATVKGICSACGPIELLINNAGIWRHTPVLQVDEAHWDEVFAVNVKGILFCSQAVAGGMVWRGAGKIVNTASVAAFEGQIGQAAYAASKGGVAGLTLPAARDLSRQGVRVVSVAPGLFETPLLASIPEPARQALGESIPFPSRLGHATEYAALVQHIVENRYLNGEVVRLDGALRMAPR